MVDADRYIRWLMADEFGTPGPDLPPDPPWYADAACRTVDLDLFYPARGQPTAPAKAICARCPVRRDCLELILALEGDETRDARAGIWAGTTPADRHALARDRRQPAAA